MFFLTKNMSSIVSPVIHHTEGGDASATFEVTSQARGKGFRFRVEAGVGDAFIRSGMYVIEELVTGAPPPVLSLTHLTQATGPAIPTSL